MPRYDIEDPTGQGFWQVVDTKDRTGPWSEVVEGKEIKHAYGGKTWVCAIFTDYLTKAGRDAQVEARTLATRLNNGPTILSAPANIRFATKVDSFNVYDGIREQVIAIFRPAFCPNAQQECDALVARLNGTQR